MPPEPVTRPEPSRRVVRPGSVLDQFKKATLLGKELDGYGDRMMRIALVLLLVAPIAAHTRAGLLADPPSRQSVSLDGTWNVIVDPYESGLSSRYFENAKPKSKSDLIEYDFDRSQKLQVPGDWNTQRNSLLLYEGPVWYQRYFAVEKKPHTRLF